jgi:hypothetical protein
MAFAEEIIHCDIEYQALSETFRAQVTFQQFVSIKNPRWSKDDVALWAKKIEESKYWRRKAIENRAKAVREIDTLPHVSRELCYNCKEPWEPDHRCRGKGRVHYIEVHYDSDEEDEYEDEALDASLEQSQDSCAFDGQLDGQDDSACSLASLSGSVEDSTLQHSGDTCEDSYVLAPRHDEIRRLDDLPLGVDMASRKSCMEDDDSYDERDTFFIFSDTYASHDT